MTLSAELRSIDCTSCGAGLNVLGGGRVTTHVCPYCGTLLDANDDYRALKSFGELQRPASAFKLGDRGRLFGVEFTVIGTLGYEEHWNGEVWAWTEHQVYSETHGYGWLNFENGHVTFSRRVRTDAWISTYQVEHSEHRPSASCGDETYRYYETTDAVISFAEGEFTWQPEPGQRTQTISALGNTGMLDFSQEETEREIYLTTYVPAKDIADGFGIELPPPLQKNHPLKPARTWAHRKFVGAVSGLFGAMLLILGLILSLNPGEQLVSRVFDINADLPATVDFEITNDQGLVVIELDSDVVDGWAGIDFLLTDPDGNPRFEIGRTSDYYSGRDGDGKWTEDGSHAAIRFRPGEKTGPYQLEIDIEEAGFWKDGISRTLLRSEFPEVVRQISVSVSQAQTSGVPAYFAAALFFVLSFVTLALPAILHQRRWAGSDWDDED
ncbi:DUF4178 domain-containing protein [Paracoccus onubensis]|uniref:DUF4178 domain-containing protein n=1 Tax=Paracoccus onubensis TaxID=1675788 RepID=A0A418SMM0_9RHOB|nr:DUF4178 domain-containing protein [Paracoccus onubensis]RJE82137.1 DUF4178 domain-containing protein [Paracoccus onubensis]